MKIMGSGRMLRVCVFLPWALASLRIGAEEAITDRAGRVIETEVNGRRFSSYVTGDPRLPEAPTVPSGLFRPYVTHETGSWAEAVAIGDLNGDGRDDVALTTSSYFDPVNDFTLHVFLQTAAGGLAPVVKYFIGSTPGSGSAPKSLDVGDVTGDGRADVVIGTGIEIGVFRQNVQGTLDPLVSYPTADSNVVKIGDFDNDGRSDVVGIDWGATHAAVFLQNVGGTLNPPTLYPANHGGRDEVEVGDLNNDGRDDIIVMSGQLLIPNFGVLLQIPGGFAPVAYYDLPGNELTRGVEVSDVTGDGLQDVIVTYGGNSPGSFIAVFQQNAAGTLNAPYSLPSYDIPEPIESADLTHDGRNDVVVLHGGWLAMGVYVQGVTGVLGAEALEPIPYSSHYNPQGLALGDINEDGEVDAVLADTINSGLVVVYHKAAHDLSLNITDSPDPVPVGSNVTYALTVTNNGYSPVAGIVLSDTLPAGMAYVSSTPAGACTSSASVITCGLGNLGPGTAAVATISATATTPGAYVNQASVVANDPDGFPADNSDSENTQFFIPCSQKLNDGGFELGSPNPFWNEASTNFGTPLCSPATCGTGGGTALPRTGAWWAWFGGINVFEQASLAQTVVIPQGLATLRFHLWIGARSGNGADYLRVLIDGSPVFSVLESTGGYSSYTLVAVDVSAFANGGSHSLRLEAATFGPGVTNFSLDDVSLEWCPRPTASVSDVSVSEGDAGPVAASFTVSLSQAAPTTVTVHYDTGPPPSAPVATPGVDYLPASGTVAFVPGTLTQTVVVAVLGDVVQEPNEMFSLNLSLPTNATIADGQGLATILDDDPPTVSISDCSAAEGNAGQVPCEFTVSLSAPFGAASTVAYTTANGSATAGSDYAAASGSLTFLAGTTSVSLPVQVFGDVVVEPDETFVVNLSAPTNATLGDAQGVGTIGDDDAPSLSSNELNHGAAQQGDLQVRPDLYRIGQKPYSSYEVVIDGTSGDIVPVALERLAGNNLTVLQSAAPVAVAGSVSLRWENTTALTVVNQHIRMDGACATPCGSDDVYRIRAFETTYSIPRFNNAGSQVTVLLLQNPADYAVAGHVWLWSTSGVLLGSQPFTLAVKQTLVLNTAAVGGAAGVGGTITVSHDGRYGDLTGKTVALEPSTGFSFDSPMMARPR